MNSDQTTIILKEQVDREMLWRLVFDASDVISAERGYSLSLLNKLGNNDFHIVTYKQAAYKYGRFFSVGPSLQGCPGRIRKMIAHKYHIDVDMVGAADRILSQILDMYDIPNPELKNFLAN